MKKHTAMKLVLAVTVATILLPAILTLTWSITERWPWPRLLPERTSLRTVKELFLGSASLPKLLWSSISLALTVGVIGTAIGLMTARATELHTFPGKGLVTMGSLLPLLVPGTVFAMGIQITLIRLGLSDTVTGVILVHLTAATPYCISIMTDVTAAVGKKWEEQAMVLGTPPVRAFFLATLPELLPGMLASLSMGFILSYSQYFTTLMVGGGRVKTLALVLVPYIQSGDRALSAVYSTAFVGSALLVFFIFEWLIRQVRKDG